MLLRDIFTAAVGSAIANRGIKNELGRQRMQDEEFEKQRRNEEINRRREEARASQREWERISKLNQERRKKGQPELPLPDRKYY